MDLDWALGALPQKVFDMKSISLAPYLCPLRFPENLTIFEALTRVLRLPSVASKRYLTNKVRVFFFNFLN
jgi:phosphoribosylformylglycinamidine synthase